MGLNTKQQQFILAEQPTKVIIAGRGFGKSFLAGVQNGIRAAGLTVGKRQIFSAMPKAKFLYVGPTLVHVKKNLLPSFIQGLGAVGFVEHVPGKQNGNFVVCKTPPKNWPKPYAAPELYTDIITFANGYTIQLTGLTDADSIRGASFDGADIDEAAMADYGDIAKVVIPTIRGNADKFYKNPMHQQLCFYTSAPWLNSGAWVWDYEKKAKQNPEEFFFIKGTSWDNVEVLGRKTLLRWEKEMPALEYKVEVMCETIDRVANAYYEKFEEKTHTYLLPVGNASDIEPDMDLHVSFDFNGNFLCCVIAQVYNQEIRVISELFTKTGNNLIDSLIDLIATNFVTHNRKKIIIYGDKMGNSRLGAINSESANYYEHIVKRFHGKGWAATVTNIGTNALHIRRHDVINKALSEQVQGCPKIRINRRRCVFLVNSLPRVGVGSDFEKDKRSERDANVPPEQATHLSDCFDYLVYRLCERAVEGRRLSPIVGFAS